MGQSLYGAIPELQLEALTTQLFEADFVVLSGDLVHDASKQGYLWIKKWAEQSQAEKLFLAGNHDDPQLMSNLLPDCEAMNLQARNFAGKLVIGLNTHLPGEITGNVSQDQCKQLADLLRESEDQQAIIFMHHHPLKVGSAGIDQYILKNRTEIQSIFEHNADKIQGVYFGHIHHDWSQTVNGVYYQSCSSTLYQTRAHFDGFEIVSNQPKYQWIDLSIS